MYSFYENPGAFYRKTGELQDILNKREAERLKLEKEPSPFLYKSMNRDKDSLQQYWQKVLEDNQRQEERNATLLRKLGKLEEHMTVLSTKTATLNALREQYSSMTKIITAMSVESIPWPTPHAPPSQDPTRNDSEHLTKNPFNGHQSTRHLFSSPVYSPSPSQYRDSGPDQSVTPTPHRTITVKDVAIQTESSAPLVCLRCRTSNFSADVTAPQDRMFRRVQSVSDLLGMNGLPKPPTPYPRASIFSSTSSLTSQNQYSANLAETWKRSSELGANRNYSYESLNFLSPIHSPTGERKNEHPINHEQMLNEVRSALQSTSNNYYANAPTHNGIELNAQLRKLPDYANSVPEALNNSRQQSVLTQSIENAPEVLNTGKCQQQSILTTNMTSVPEVLNNSRQQSILTKSMESASEVLNNCQQSILTNMTSEPEVLNTGNSRKQSILTTSVAIENNALPQTGNLHLQPKEQIPENVHQTPLSDSKDGEAVVVKAYIEKQNSVTISIDQEIHATPSEHRPFESCAGIDQEPQHVQNVVENISVSTQPDLATKHNRVALAETTDTKAEDKHAVKETVELSQLHKTPIDGSVNGSKSVEQQRVVTSPNLSTDLHGRDETKEQEGTLQVEKASVESEKLTIGLDNSFKRQEKDSSDEDDSFFKNETSFQNTDAYKMLLGSVPPAKKNPSVGATSSESSDDIENAFFSSVMTNPVEKEKQNAITSVSPSKNTENAEIAMEGKKTGGAIPKAVTAEDRQRIAKKVMNFGANSDSDIELPATKHDSDSDDDFFS